MTAPTPRPTLRALPLPSRLVVAAFLASAGVGYLAALAQLHFQAASPGGAAGSLLGSPTGHSKER